ncbi:MAG: amino acid ABC transporter substrate-binding protein [Anaerolineae bacterium]|nr:MAG: amino acid ABC transporter substrate-binding protein [Anaerolineae bacterium]
MVARQRWLVAVPVLILIGVAGWLFLRGAKPDQSLRHLQTRGELKVCMDASYPPFEWIPESAPADHIVGLDVDLAQAIAARLGVTATLVNVGWDGLYDSLLVGKCDAIISALPYDPTRTEEAAFSISYFNAGPVLLRQAGDTGVSGPEDLAGRTLAVTWGSAGDVEASALQRKLRDLTVRRMPDPVEVLDALRAGEVDAALTDHLTALQATYISSDLAVVGGPLTDDLYVIAVRRGEAALLAAINEALIAFRDNGMLEALKESWFQR